MYTVVLTIVLIAMELLIIVLYAWKIILWIQVEDAAHIPPQLLAIDNIARPATMMGHVTLVFIIMYYIMEHAFAHSKIVSNVCRTHIVQFVLILWLLVFSTSLVVYLKWFLKQIVKFLIVYNVKTCTNVLSVAMVLA